ncbi:PAS-domain containing protein [Roseiarcus fermentans]|uniref:PAS-domain containing protein n=1 Tax=Roseiarcus fermentans TaxID=1473586 RepID=UPI001473BB92|nr:PAS-domain containing protein [Roseiarcus fermentans]
MKTWRETRWIAAFGLALVVVVWVAVGVLIVKARSDAISDNFKEEYTSAAVFAEQATRTIRLLDSVMQLVAHELAKSPTPGRLKELVDEKVIPLDTLVLWSFIGADGRTVGSSLGPDPKHTDLSDREHIRVQLDRRVDGLFIGKPVLGRVSGKWSIQLTRRVEDSSAGTLGVLVASIDPHYFERFWNKVGGSRQDVDELIGLDGVLRARSADVEAALTSHERRDALVEETEGKRSGFLEVKDGEGRTWLTAYVRLEELPLIVTAGVAARTALAEGWPAVVAYASFGTAITLLIAGFSVMLVRLAARLRERTRQARLAERRLSLAIETIPQGFALFDPDDRLIVFNQAYLQIYATTAGVIRPGVSFEQLLRAGLERGQFVEARGNEEAWLSARIDGHRNPAAALEQLTDTGRWLRIEERKTSDGSVVGLQSDITELKRRTFELSRQTSLLQTTLQNMGEGVAVYDRARMLIAWNGLCADLLQAPPELFQEGVPFERVLRFQAERGDFGAVDIDADLARRVEAFHSEKPWTAERRRKDGRAIEIRHYPMPDGGAVFLYRDITERSDTEARLNVALRKAEEASKAKSEFLAMISHEIRTPMNAIIGMSALLTERDLGPTEMRFAETIAEAGEKLLVIIDDLLDFSRLEAGKLSVEARPFDIRRVVASAIEILRGQPNAGALSLTACIDDSVPAVLVGDGGRISQILLNLLGNAVKYTGHGGATVRVQCRNEPGAEATTLRCEIEDTGPGIAPALQERLFLPFERGPTVDGKAISGAGLGLAICRQLVDLMEGRMGLVSTPGKGSTFWFEISLHAPQEEQPRREAPSTRAPKKRRLHVLVAEDIEANRTVIGAMLQTLGHAAHMVEDGEQAIAAALAGDYDVILMDIQMPRVNGLAAIRAIRGHDGRARRVPIVAVTAFAQQSDRKEAMNAGADDYLTKPVRKTELQAALEAVTGTIAPTDGARAPAVDESVLAELREDLGDDSFARLLGRCVEDIQERLGKLEAAAAANDGKQIRALAHQLKGLLAQFGAAEAAAAASTAETGDDGAMAQNLATLRAAAEAALARFQELRGAASG